ncbi:MAG: hypothetical protein RIR11_43 [Bacteroidota bacterium]|jgi:hypothetical protein
MKRAFSGAKQPMNNEKWGKIRPPNLYLYLNLIPIALRCLYLSETEQYVFDIEHYFWGIYFTKN